MVRFLRKNNSVTLTDASAEALSRKLYYREIDFVIRIPEGFTESLFDLSADNENEELIVSSVPGSTEGQFMKAELSQFLNQMRALRISGMTDEEAADKASSLSDETSAPVGASAVVVRGMAADSVFSLELVLPHATRLIPMLTANISDKIFFIINSSFSCNAI